MLFLIGSRCGSNDSDRDGCPDDADECPDDFGTKMNNYCPDTDKDGTIDREDDCPNEYALGEAKGCPDVDEDRVPDRNERDPGNIDQCLNITGSDANCGCPMSDYDEDGIQDCHDSCLTEGDRRYVDEKGCWKYIRTACEDREDHYATINWDGKTFDLAQKPLLDKLVNHQQWADTANWLIIRAFELESMPHPNYEVLEERCRIISNHLIEYVGIDPARIKINVCGKDGRNCQCPVPENFTNADVIILKWKWE